MVEISNLTDIETHSLLNKVGWQHCKRISKQWVHEMGKVKKLRQKYHLSLKKSKSLNNLSETNIQKTDVQPKENLLEEDENIFAGINISWDDINKTLPKDFDVRSVISTKSRKELKEDERHLKKKEKKKLRHERFIKKLDVTHQLLKESKSKKKKKKANLGNDMSSLLDALPSLQSPVSNSKKYEKPKSKPKGILKTKQRLKQQAIDTKVFKHILDDKTFRENPLQAVSQYLKQKVALDS